MQNEGRSVESGEMRVKEIHRKNRNPSIKWREMLGKGEIVMADLVMCLLEPNVIGSIEALTNSLIINLMR